MLSEIRTITTRLVFFAILLAFPSCQKFDLYGRFSGTQISFGAQSNGTESSITKTSYSGQKYGNTTKYERIDWTTGDVIYVYCNEASTSELNAEGVPTKKYARYKVSSVAQNPTDQVSKAEIELVNNAKGTETGLRWGTGTHTFFATYPDPTTGICKSFSTNTVSAELPIEQNTLSSGLVKTGNNFVLNPDMKWQLMTARETAEPGNTVTLKFFPQVTAIQFTISNGSSANLQVEAVELIYNDLHPYTDASKIKPVCGPFTCQIKANNANSFASSASALTYNKVTLTLAEPISLVKDATFTFTFFLSPLFDIDNLTFKVVKDISENDSVKTHIGYTDGTGIKFPARTKSFIKGLVVPDGSMKLSVSVAGWGSVINIDSSHDYFDANFE